MKQINKFDLAVSVGYDFQIEEKGFNDMRDNSIKAIELSFGDYSNFDFKGIKKLADTYDISLWSLHLPFLPFETLDVSSTESEMRNSNLIMLSDIIARAGDVGIDKFVIHASGEPVLPPVRSERMKCSKDSIYSLSEFAKKFNSSIAVENLPRTCLGKNSKEINELTSVNENVVVCYDTNHLLEESAADFVKNLDKKIATVHISDYDFVTERHWLPGCGKVDWKEIIDLLNYKEYIGPFLYEVSIKKGNYPSDREVTFLDFKENYSNLMK